MWQRGAAEETWLPGFTRFDSWESFVLAHSWRHADRGYIGMNFPSTCQQENGRLSLHLISVLLMARMPSASSDALAFDSLSWSFMRKPFP